MKTRDPVFVAHDLITLLNDMGIKSAFKSFSGWNVIANYVRRRRQVRYPQ